MSSIVSLIEPYERRARLYPMLIVLTPVILAVGSWLPEEIDLWALGGSVLISLAGAALLSQLARDQGKAQEPSLFARWGGTPSVRALSFQSAVFDTKSLSRYHGKLASVDPGLIFPTNVEEEVADVAGFTSVYESANRILLARTRDREKFRLVFEENVNYGFRRNLWAMKAAGIFCAALGISAAGGRLAFDAFTGVTLTATSIVTFVVSAFLLVIWAFRVKPQWVRIAADAYAQQLVIASELIGDTTSRKQHAR